jgi:hypothetical protein
MTGSDSSYPYAHNETQLPHAPAQLALPVETQEPLPTSLSTYTLIFDPLLFAQAFSIYFTRHRNSKWSSFLNSLQPKTTQFWKITRYFTKSPISIPPNPPGEQVYLSPHNAEFLAQQFEHSHLLTLNLCTPSSLHKDNPICRWILSRHYSPHSLSTAHKHLRNQTQNYISKT